MGRRCRTACLRCAGFAAVATRDGVKRDAAAGTYFGGSATEYSGGDTSEPNLGPDQKIESNIYQDDEEGNVKETDELEEKRLFSIADYLLDPKNFEATLRTTIVMNNVGTESTSSNASTVETSGAKGTETTTIKRKRKHRNKQKPMNHHRSHQQLDRRAAKMKRHRQCIK
ncbi:unnamed protein product [Acanthoscelides obtectus]|uniref:Uncharacterized protein n=1 Tax=Acanthoscelides obtectus TaxID=200917 RepID=A0A9P0PZV4_ACAOB|nr:unnamed protein product [Acanthoscelides obtectus]CAK1658637.1 hypothetical protein AOBTE_LOCUS21042 [Acanthoscelides obtectus]